MVLEFVWRNQNSDHRHIAETKTAVITTRYLRRSYDLNISIYPLSFFLFCIFCKQQDELIKYFQMKTYVLLGRAEQTARKTKRNREKENERRKVRVKVRYVIVTTTCKKDNVGESEKENCNNNNVQ